MEQQNSHKTVGYWAAIFASVFSIAYFVAQLFEWMGMLGSHGDLKALVLRWALYYC
ncbi:hypothetical protein LQ318_00845 [Aliifodinibius salicampi]|uniref:Uncharacterized protein n=1 Tax=Fodinibius salicampi TaxID=1920655 RepID=A0ABT3PUB6_9BACT|nr:hypothetical protein [Fodinibius salicampi]MCW9711436.1 hypothetical protein [Fodinibius salicampi]